MVLLPHLQALQIGHFKHCKQSTKLRVSGGESRREGRSLATVFNFSVACFNALTTSSSVIYSHSNLVWFEPQVGLFAQLRFILLR